MEKRRSESENENKSLDLVYKGEIEGIDTQLHFVASDAAGKHLMDEDLMIRRDQDMDSPLTEANRRKP